MENSSRQYYPQFGSDLDFFGGARFFPSQHSLQDYPYKHRMNRVTHNSLNLDIGGDGSLNQITLVQILFPVQTYALNPNWTTLPVGGGTGGQGITVNAEITVGEVSIFNAGTIDA